MKKTILITGTSTGIGRAAVGKFQNEGWQVAATMRNPESGADLARLDGVRVYQLDVTDEDQARSACAAAIHDFGGVDALLNNAGFGLFGPFETADSARIERQFRTNVFGVMNVTRAILPHFRERRAGLIMNLTSIGGLVTLPLNSIYHGAKWAVEGWTESLRFELEAAGIRVKLIEPGGVATDFTGRSLERTDDHPIPDYAEYVNRLVELFMSRSGNYSSAAEIAAGIFAAATDESDRLRYVVGRDAEQLWAARLALKPEEFYAMMKKNFSTEPAPVQK